MNAMRVLLPGLLFLSGTALAADDAIETQRRAVGGGGRFDNSGAAIVAPPVPAPQVRIVTYTAVSPVRQWTNLEGKTMIGQLLAFSAPKEGETGPVLVVVEEKVRFLLHTASGKTKVTDYPLANLSKDDKAFVENIAKQALKGPPPKPAPTVEPKKP